MSIRPDRVSSSSCYLPNNATVCTPAWIRSRRAGQQGPIWTLTAALKRSIKTVTGCIYIHHQTPASAHRSWLCRTASSNWANSVRPRCVIIARLSGSQSPVSRFMSDRPKHSPDPQWLFLFLCLGEQGNGVLAPLSIGKWRSCTSRFVQMHRNGRRNATGTVVYDRMTTYVQNNNWRQLLVAGSQRRDRIVVVSARYSRGPL